MSLVDVTINMSHSSLSIEQTVFGLPLILTSIIELNSSKPFKVMLLVPLTLVFLALVQVREEVAPDEPLATSFIIEHNEHLFVSE
jgi:hypothetical protein